MLVAKSENKPNFLAGDVVVIRSRFRIISTVVNSQSTSRVLFLIYQRIINLSVSNSNAQIVIVIVHLRYRMLLGSVHKKVPKTSTSRTWMTLFHFKTFLDHFKQLIF